MRAVWERRLFLLWARALMQNRTGFCAAMARMDGCIAAEAERRGAGVVERGGLENR